MCKRVKKNKNGFTLIELLLVIALIISVLGIAIFSVTKLSKKQKESAYESVKEEIYTATAQYFASNEYMFEGINEGGYGIIPVEHLVDLDYLNKLTNPVTGNALNKCDRVKVTKRENNTFDFEFIESTEPSCTYVGMEFAADDKAPTASAYFVKDDNVDKPSSQIDANGDKWYNIDELSGSALNVIIETDGYIDGICFGDNEDDCTLSSPYSNIGVESVSKGYRDGITYQNDRKKEYVTYKVCNNVTCKTAKVYGGKDTTKPTCTASVSPNKSESYVHKKEEPPTLKFTATDTLSGIYGSSTYEPTISGGEKTYSKEFYDNAGNKNKCERKVVYDDVNPTCPSTLLTYTNVTSGKNSFCNTSKSTGVWHCTSVKATLNKGSNWAKYKWDGVETTATTKTYDSSGTYKSTVTAYDKYGDSITCTAAEFKIDKVQPTCTASLSPSTPASGWFKTAPTLTFKGTDTLSGINGSSTYKPTISGGEKTYSKEFYDNAGNKNSCNQVVKLDNTNPTCPSTLLTYTDVTSGKNSFCNTSKSTGVWHCTSVKATLNKGSNWVKYKWDGVETTSTTKTYDSSGTYKPTITAYDAQGDSITCTAAEFKIDKVQPTCTASLSPSTPASGWFKTAPTLTFKGTDTLSGINGSSTYKPTISGGEKTYSKEFYDNAGNKNSCNQVVKLDNTNPTCPSTLLTYTDVTSGKNSFCNTSKSTGVWHCTSVKATLNKGSNWVKYKWDGVETTSTTKTYDSSGTYKPTITAYDAQGDSITCTAAEFKIDKSQPYVTLSLTVEEDGYAVSMENKWYNKNIDYKAIVSDSYSGVNTIHKYWNKSGLNSDDAKSTAYSWNSTSGEYKNGGNASVSVTKGTTSTTTPSSYLSAEGHRKIRYTVCDQAGNCNSAAKDAKIDKTPPAKPTLNTTPTICQVYGSGYSTYAQTDNRVLQIISASTFNASSCTKSFTYTGGKFNGKLTQAEPGSYVLYAEYKSSDALSGLEKTIGKPGYVSYYGWKFVDKYYAYGETTPSTLCSADKGKEKKGGYPCRVTRTVTVTDKAGNVSSATTATYNNLSY